MWKQLCRTDSKELRDKCVFFFLLGAAVLSHGYHFSGCKSNHTLKRLRQYFFFPQRIFLLNMEHILCVKGLIKWLNFPPYDRKKKNPLSDKVNLLLFFLDQRTASPSSLLPSSSTSPSVSPWLGVLAARSHLVAQQHDDHILLGVLVDLCQPGLDTEKERNPVEED